jgi:VCBS repeat-containing protein
MPKSKKSAGRSGHDDHHDRDSHHHHHHHHADKGLKLTGTKGDDVLTGTERNDKLFGGKGNDKLFGLAGDDKLDGGKGNDALDGGAGRDLLIGGKGDDSLLGGDGDDVLYGDAAGMGSPWTWGKCFGWNPRSDGDDFLDGGAGNDKVYAGRGDDLLLYSMAGNLGADFADIGTHDVYDGGSGFDTLVLELTHGESLLDSVQDDIEAFEAFLDRKADPRGDHGKTFHFQSFDLDARNIEALEIQLINNAPTANADAAGTDEDTPVAIGAASLLANDTDPDHLDVLAVIGADALSALGAAISRDAGGNLTYDPTGALALQQLAEGATATDSFGYTISDLAGETATAFVQVTVTGVNDRPVAQGDSNATDEDHAVTGNVLANDADIDIGDTLAVAAVNGSAAGVGVPIVLDSGALLTVNAIGSYTYDPAGRFEYLAVGKSAADSFTYVVSDNHGAQSDPVTVSLTITGVNDMPVAVDDRVNPDGGGGGVETLLDFNGGPYDAAENGFFIDGYRIFGFQFPGVGVGGSAVAAVGTEFNAASADGADNALLRTDPQDFAAHSLAVASNAGSFQLTIAGFNNGVQVASLPSPVIVSPYNTVGYTTVSFDVTWGSIDELRFYADVANDFILLDDIRVSVGGSTASGVSEDAAIDIAFEDLLSNDTDVDIGDLLELLSAEATSAMGATIGLLDGKLHYDPTTAAAIQALAQGETDTDTFTYTVSDGNGGTDTATVSVVLRGVNDAPDAQNDARSTSEDSAISGNVLANDTDAEGDTLAVTNAGAFSSTLGAAVTLAADGSFTYDPTASPALQALAGGTSAADSFSYSVSDGNGGTDTAIVAITVAGLNEPAPGGSSKVLASVSPSVELEYYIRIDGSPEWLQLEGFSMGLSNSGSLGGAGGGAGKASATDVHSVLGSSSTIVELTEALATGGHIKNVEIEAYRAGGDKGDLLVDQYYFEDVLVTGLNTGGSAFGTANSLSFDFAKFNHGHVEQDDKGGVGAITEAGFDFAENKSFEGGPSIAGDAIKAQLDEGLPTDVQLEYYVTFDGAPGWLELHSFSMGLANSGSGGFGGGGGAGKASASDVSLLLGSSAQILDLTEGVTEGVHFKFFEVEAYRAGGDKGAQLVDQYYFEDVLVTGLNTGGANFNSVSLDFAKFSHGHLEQDAQGGVGPTTETGWDFAENKVFSHAVAADLGKDIPLESVSPSVELEYYIRIDGSPEWLQLEGFSMGLSNSGSLGGAGGGAGKASATDVHSVLGSSSTIVELTEALATGGHIKNVEIEAYRAGGDKGDLLVDQYYFEDVLVTGLNTGGSAFGTANSLSFDFAKFNHGHVEQDDKGGVGAITEAGFDFAENKSFEGGPSIAGDAIKAQLDEGLPTDVQLEYYVTFDGAPGWLELHSFSMGLANSGSGGFGGGGGAGKASASDVSLLLGSSAQILDLTEGVTEGVHFKFFEVEAYRAGGDKGAQLVDQYYFEDVLVTGLNTGGANFNSVSLDFAKFSHGHLEQDAQGGVGPTTETGWDFAENKVFSHAVAADLGKDIPLESVSPSVELEYYIRIDGSPEWLQLEGFSMGLSNSGSLGGAGGGAGKASATDVHSVLGSSSTIVELTEALATGGHIKNVEIEAYRAGGDKGDLLVDQYYFEDVLVTGLNTGGSAFGTANSLSFDFAKFNHGHVEQDDKGGVGAITEAGFDFAENKSFEGGPSIAGDAIKAQLDEGLPTDVQLEYYVTFDGAPGWLELHSFSMGLANSGSGGFGGGGGAGKASASDVSLLLGSSAQILDLTEGVTEGVHFKFFEVEAYRAGGDKGAQLVDQYYFEDVLVTGLNTGGANFNSVSLDFAKFSHGHLEQDAQGGVGPTTETGWDFVQNEAFSHPVAPDVDLF